MQRVANNLGKIVESIRASALAVDQASETIAGHNTDLSSRTEQTSSALQQTVSALEQLAGAIRQSADSAAQADQLAQTATQIAREGGAAVADVIHTMASIDHQSGRIGEIVSVIDSIAFQTNILALNAAVEAARAGEQGLGFAVVAQEVRTLAGRSGAAAQEIRALIAESVTQVQSGTQKVHVAGATMQRIVDSIEQVSSMVNDIARCSSQQASQLSDINQNVAEVDQSTQKNASLVEQAAHTAQGLKAQASDLVEVMNTFRTAA